MSEILAIQDLEQFGINPDLVGECLNRPVMPWLPSSAWHDVFAYGTNQVIKIPNHIMGLEPRPATIIRQHQQILQEAFGREKILNAQVRICGDNYIIVQDRYAYTARPFNITDLTTLEGPLDEIIVLNQQIIADTGFSLDFLGLAAVGNHLAQLAGSKISANLANIIVDQKQLLLPDLDLLYTPYYQAQQIENPLNIAVLKHSFWWQKLAMQHIWGKNIDPFIRK